MKEELMTKTALQPKLYVSMFRV